MKYLKFSLRANVFFLLPAIPFLQAPVLLMNHQPVPPELTRFFLWSVAIFTIAAMISVGVFSLAERQYESAKALVYIFLLPLLVVIWACIDSVIRYINAPAGGGRGLAMFILIPILSFLFVVSFRYFTRMKQKVSEIMKVAYGGAD